MKTDGNGAISINRELISLSPSIGRPSLLKKGMQPSSFRTAGCMLKKTEPPFLLERQRLSVT